MGSLFNVIHSIDANRCCEIQINDMQIQGPIFMRLRIKI